MISPKSTPSPRRPVPAPERPRHLEVVRGRPTSGRRPPKRFVALCMLVTGIGLFCLVLSNVLLGQAAFQHAELETRIQTKRVAVEEQTIDVLRAKAPSLIAARAREIGMVPAADVTVVVPRSSSADRGPSPKRAGP